MRNQNRISCLGDHFLVERNQGSDGKIAQPLGFKRKLDGAMKMIEVKFCRI